MRPPAMIPEIDIWRSAHLMIQQHRKDAAHQADARARALIERSDSAGGLIWRRIRQAIGQLQVQE